MSTKKNPEPGDHTGPDYDDKGRLDYPEYSLVAVPSTNEHDGFESPRLKGFAEHLNGLSSMGYTITRQVGPVLVLVRHSIPMEEVAFRDAARGTAPAAEESPEGEGAPEGETQ